MRTSVVSLSEGMKFGHSMLAVGIDFVEVARVNRSVSRFGQRFLSRIFTEREQEYCNGRAESLAARFALKEAVGKASRNGDRRYWLARH